MEVDQLQQMISATLKKNQKAEIGKADLVKLVTYMEGELQARDIVIAALKVERVKQLVRHTRYGRLLPLNNPYVALQRDCLSFAQNEAVTEDTAAMKVVSEAPTVALNTLVTQYRQSHQKLMQVMQDAETRHAKVLHELEEEKRKHEHDTAQGDDITYGLEKDRTRLKEELELERQAKKKLEKELKKLQETLEEERERQKQIVLLLLAERKKLILKYVEERNRSEDLAQILSEEKGRVDTMAEGLEEESQKALQMEAELEKHLATFDGERTQLRAHLTREEKRNKELELLVEKLQMEVEHLKKQQAEAHQVAMFQAGLNQSTSPRATLSRPAVPTLASAAVPTGTSATPGNISPPQLPLKPVALPPQTPPRTTPSSGSSSPISTPRASPCPTIIPLTSASGHVVLGSAGKVLQPTATVTSMPVPAPTTGFARAVSPAGGIRNVQYSSGGATLEQRTGSAAATVATPAGSSSVSTPTPSRVLPPPPVHAAGDNTAVDINTLVRSTAVVAGNQQSSRVAVSASPGTKVFTTTNKEGKVTFHVTTSATLPASTSTAAAVNSTAGQPTTPRKTPPATRGAPPPVPPNKPVVPPKKESRAGTGQTPVSSPVVISSCVPQTATVDHGQPISLEVKPQKVGPQGVKFGITISKDKIQISSNPSHVAAASVSSPSGGTPSPADASMQWPVDSSGEVGDEKEIALHASSTAPSFSLAVVAPELDVLDKELADFQQLLYSMASYPSATASGSLTLSPGG